LRGGRESTWTKNQVTWPKDLLPKDIEKSRIISFGYDSGVAHSNTAEITQGSLENDARSLCSQLKVLRANDNSVNIINHSKDLIF
jgi:protein SERAC1